MKKAKNIKVLPRKYRRTDNPVFTTVTLDDLKESRNEIISHIKKYTNDVKEVMNEMIVYLVDTEFADVIEFTDDVLLKMGYFDNASNWLAENNRKNALANLPSSMRK